MSKQQIQRPPACVPYGSSDVYEWAYLPSLGPGIAFAVIFGIVALIQASYMFKYRAWWMFFLVVGAGLEVLGWVGRVVAHYCPYSNTMNTMQTATLIMGPAWTQAGVYIAMWVLVQIVGNWISPVKPAVYLWICVVVDTICLTLQAVGGGLAGDAASNFEDPQTGTTIMVVGIIAQLVCGLIFFMFLSFVYWRGRHEIWAKKSLTLCAAAIAFSTTMMNLRGFYRSVELVQGWRGYLISHESYVIGLDAVPMVLAMGVLAILSPGPLLAKQRREQIHQKPDTNGTSTSLECGESDDSEKPMPVAPAETTHKQEK